MEYTIRDYRDEDIAPLTERFFVPDSVELFAGKTSQELMCLLEDLNRGKGRGMVFIVELGGAPFAAGWVGMSRTSTRQKPKTAVFALGPKQAFDGKPYFMKAVGDEMKNLAHKKLFGEPWRPTSWDPDIRL